MIPGDYIERDRETPSGKIVTDKIVKSTSGVEYIIGRKNDINGSRNIYRARRLFDGKECVFKEYIPSPESSRMHNAIKRNIQIFMKCPLTEDDGKTPLLSFIGPLDKDSLIDLPQSNGFGYIMEPIDTEVFFPVSNLWRQDVYPNISIIFKACYNIAHLFRRIHFKGWCYKDINEGNIYINYRTGDIRIIDCDNIGIQSAKAIKGSDGYMAPEIYVTNSPDVYTDYFSMAVLFYRLLVGGYPMDGKKTRQYLSNHRLSAQEAASTIYGSKALFVFDPNDNSNEIRELIDFDYPHKYELQVKRWNSLPIEIQQRFIQTFSVGLANNNRNKRATDRDWMQTLKGIESSGIQDSESRDDQDDEYQHLGNIWRKNLYPDDYTLCKIGFHLARKCLEIHLREKIIANEWNEGNVLIDVKNCNISIEKFYATGSMMASYHGTNGYLPPEHYSTHQYDIYSDYYGLAVFLYRLFIGGFPLDGRLSEEYLANNDWLINEAAPVIYGSHALFVFDPYNQSNSIRNYVNKYKTRMYELQTQRWDSIDDRIKKCFIQTFSDGLQADNKQKRTTDREWMQVFKVVAKTGLKQCPVCHRRLFIGRTVCPWCK